MQAAVERIVFAGFEACVGPFVLGLFWLPGFLGVVGLSVLAATGEIATTAEVLVRAAAIEPSVVITADFIHGFITAATLGTDESRLMAAGLALRFVDGTL
mgnify:CR=1 FL=1